MKISDWLKKSTEVLKAVGISTARLDCLILLEDNLKKDRAWILSNLEYVLSKPQLHQLNSNLKRRQYHEPLAYIRGLKEFYSNNFVVNKFTLIPRPETEDLIDMALSIKDKGDVLDVGTGCGAIAISIALNCQNKVYGTDISQDALQVAKSNTKKLGANVIFYKNDLLNNVNTHYKIVVANLPYLPKSMKKTIQKDLFYEPAISLWVDGDGLDLYRKFFKQINNMLLPPQHIIAESLVVQHKMMINLAIKSGYQLLSTSGLAQYFIKN
jgi:release factor glutamine methyltransferase